MQVEALVATTPLGRLSPSSANPSSRRDNLLATLLHVTVTLRLLLRIELLNGIIECDIIVLKNISYLLLFRVESIHGSLLVYFFYSGFERLGQPERTALWKLEFKIQ